MPFEIVTIPNETGGFGRLFHNLFPDAPPIVEILPAGLETGGEARADRHDGSMCGRADR